MKTLKTQKDTGTDIETQTERQTGRQTHIELFNWYHCIIKNGRIQVCAFLYFSEKVCRKGKPELNETDDWRGWRAPKWEGEHRKDWKGQTEISLRLPFCILLTLIIMSIFHNSKKSLRLKAKPHKG